MPITILLKADLFFCYLFFIFDRLLIANYSHKHNFAKDND